MAESEGFEPPEGYPSTVFKTAAFGRSASSPEISCVPKAEELKSPPGLLAYYNHLQPRVIRNLAYR